MVSGESHETDNSQPDVHAVHGAGVVAVVMNCSTCSFPARVSGVRNRRRHPSNGLAFPAAALRIDSADRAVVLYYLCAENRNAYDYRCGLVLVDLHDRFLDLVFRVGRHLAGRDGAGAVCPLIP